MSLSAPGPVDLVLPVFNEAGELEGSVERLSRAMAGHEDLDWRIVVADNGSTDQTAAIGRRLAETRPRVRFLHRDRRGRGGALRQAWTQTDAELSIYMDVDLSTDLAALPEVIGLLGDGADLVTGSRLDRRSRVTRSRKRDLLSRAYNRLIRLAFRTRSFDDAQCGFKGVRIASVRPLLPLVRDDDWFFDTELLILAEYAGLTVRTLPITWVEDADSRVRIAATIWEDLCGLARLRLTARRLVSRL